MDKGKMTIIYYYNNNNNNTIYYHSLSWHYHTLQNTQVHDKTTWPGGI